MKKKQNQKKQFSKSFSSKHQKTYDSPYSMDSDYKNRPRVVIAGRPNVGKSTLFNRFLNRRLAIVDSKPGVTRDPVEKNAFILGYPVKLIDTGGFKLDRDHGSDEAIMDELVVEKTLETLKNCDLIVLVLEVGEITAEDEEFIALLRPYWDKVIAAVNKTEGGRKEEEAWNFMQFGFQSLHLISASHGDGITAFAKEIISRLDFSAVEEGSEEKPIKVSIMGKPNTGKSTLSNVLTKSSASIVSDYAGTTRDVVEGFFSYKGKNFHLLDTAGIRKKTKVKEDIEYYSVNRAIKTLQNCDLVFYILDAEEGLTDQDKKIISLAHDRGRGIIFILNKWDLQEDTKQSRKKAEEDIRIHFGHMIWAPVLCISALEKQGITPLLNTALKLYGQLTKKIDTPSLNLALKEWIRSYPPPQSKASQFKLRYCVQSNTNPISFILFASRPEVVPQSYITYLKNKIRSDLGFDNIPIILELKASRQKWEDRES